MTNWILKRTALTISLVTLGLVVPALSAQEDQKDAPQGEAQQQAIEPIKPLSEESGAAAPVDHKTYIIGAEDGLQIRVWREPEVSGVVIVRPDGNVTLPLIGDVMASGRTPDQLKTEITEKLSEFLTRPEVMVSVTAIRSKKYYITGSVNRTGAFPLVVPTTVLEALSGAGGFGEWANKGKIVILRGGKRFKFNYKQVIKGKNLEQNIYLENGDHIIVP